MVIKLRSSIFEGVFDRHLYEVVESESNKKLKQQPSVSEKDVSSDFAVMMKWMKQEFDGVKSDLTKTIDNRVDSLEEKLRNVMLTVVKEEVDKARKEFNDRIDGMASKVETKLRQSLENKIEVKLKQAKDEIKGEFDLATIQQEISTVKKSYAEATKTDIGTENDIVIRNYVVDPKEAEDTQVTFNKVNSLIRDGLKFTDVTLVKCERKKSHGNRPGVIIATIESRDQKQKLLDNKKKLRNTRAFSNVYIEDVRPLSSRINEANMMTVLHELGKKEQYFLSGNGRIVRKGANGNQRNTRDRSQR